MAGRKAKPVARPRKRQDSLGRKKANGAGTDHRLADALAQQAATAEILKIIAGSPANLQKVFDTVAKRAAKLCDSAQVTVMIRDGDVVRVRSTYSRGNEIEPPVGHAIPIRKTLTAGRAALRKRTIHVKDVVPLLRTEYPDARENQKRFGFRTVLAVPMMHKGEAVGVLYAWRREVRAFAPEQVALLESFADQAVIAIENARSFNQTKEALERQTATAEILKVIAGSPSDVQPVFDAIAKSSIRLFGGHTATVTQVVDKSLHLAAFTSPTDSESGVIKGFFPRHISSADLLGKAVLSGKPEFRSDIESDTEVSDEAKEVARVRGYRSLLAVPMLRESACIGTISVS
ncbi:MAG TPA: GAF domain-containing protein, partial [Burkholderiales bacterium]|nr:GAF domain-containing protein [Burkholderiales bacterium]